MINLIIVRHGKTDWNEKQLLQGRSDIPLNEIGFLDARALAKQLDENTIDLCICSPLTRAKQTADLLIKNTQIILDDLLVERNFGELEGKKFDLNKVYYFWDYNLNYCEKGVESLQCSLKRAGEFLKKIKQKYNNKTILIVSHGAFIKALHFNLIGYDENTDFLSFDPQNTHPYYYTLK